MSAVVQVARSQLARRGVAKLRHKVLGRNAYVAVTSTLEILYGTVYLVTDDVGDASLVAWLNRELRRADPGKERHLSIVRRSVEPTIDGPSPTHPEIAGAEEQRVAEASAEAETVDVSWILAAYPEGHIMRDVCLNLSAALQRHA